MALAALGAAAAADVVMYKGKGTKLSSILFSGKNNPGKALQKATGVTKTPVQKAASKTEEIVKQTADKLLGNTDERIACLNNIEYYANMIKKQQQKVF